MFLVNVSYTCRTLDTPQTRYPLCSTVRLPLLNDTTPRYPQINRAGFTLSATRGSFILYEREKKIRHIQSVNLYL